MAEKKTAKVIYRKSLSPLLEIFRIVPEDGTPFPDYLAGQYIALSRDHCKLTRKVTDERSHVHYIYDTDDAGNIKQGTVTHSYSIASAPLETKRSGYLEFFVVLELIKMETPGRLSESLFHLNPESDNTLWYMNKIVGDFTLEKRAAGYEHVVMVGTGTGLAPFASMVKQLYLEAQRGKVDRRQFTLFYANRTYNELAYHEELRAIESNKKFDFVYVPSVSRPIQRDYEDVTMGIGRANNILRSIFGMPLKEEEEVSELLAAGEDASRARKILQRTVHPALPRTYSDEDLIARMKQPRTVLLTCGNPSVMEDIKHIADANGTKFEKEEW